MISKLHGGLCGFGSKESISYHTGKQTGTYEPLFRTGKNTGRTSEIWLFRLVSGYQIGTFSHAALIFCLSFPHLYHTGDDEILIGGEERRR